MINILGGIMLDNKSNTNQTSGFEAEAVSIAADATSGAAASKATKANIKATHAKPAKPGIKVAQLATEKKTLKDSGEEWALLAEEEILDNEEPIIVAELETDSDAGATEPAATDDNAGAELGDADAGGAVAGGAKPGFAPIALGVLGLGAIAAATSGGGGGSSSSSSPNPPPPSNEGQTFLLTVGEDTSPEFDGTDKDDIYNAPLDFGFEGRNEFSVDITGGYNYQGEGRDITFNFTNGYQLIVEFDSTTKLNKEDLVSKEIASLINTGFYVLLDPEGNVVLGGFGEKNILATTAFAPTNVDTLFIDIDTRVVLTGQNFELLSAQFNDDPGPGNREPVAGSIINGLLNPVVPVNTLDDKDVLNGNGGVDTLNASILVGSDVAPTLNSIEILNLTAVDSEADTNGPSIQGTDFAGYFAGLNLQNATGVEQIWNVSSSGNLDVYNVAADSIGEDDQFNLVATPSDIALGLKNITRDSYMDITYAADVQLLDDTQRIFIQSAGVVGDDVVAELGVYGEDTLNLDIANITASGNSNVLFAGFLSEVKEINITDVENDLSTLKLRGGNDFSSLENLNAENYNGDLDIDISGSTILESVTTGKGDDRVVVDAQYLDPLVVALEGQPQPLELNLGTGRNTLAFANTGILNAGDINDLVFTNTGISSFDSVNVIEFVEAAILDGDAKLNLTGLVNIQAVDFAAGLDGGGNTLTIDNGEDSEPETFAVLSSDGAIEDITLATGAVKNLSVVAKDNVEIDAIESDVLVNLLVESTTGNAELKLTGTPAQPGQNAIPGTKESWSFTIDVTGQANGNQQQTVAGTITIFGLLGNNITIDYSYSATSQPDAATLDTNVAAQILAALNATISGSRVYPEFTAALNGNIITITWAEVGDLNKTVTVVGDAGTGGDSIAPMPVTNINGSNPVGEIPAKDGEGYEKLEIIEVKAGVDDDAIVDLTDVYGSFDLKVSAGDEAFITLVDTPNIKTIDVSGVDNFALIEVEYAAFAGNVTIIIGESDIDYFGANNSVETFLFVGDDIGNVDISGFTAGIGGDVIDFRTFGVKVEDLAIDDNTSDLIITHTGQVGDIGYFSGIITLVNVEYDANNFLYA
jgi:hypothetical protein